jgi:hypothetical protein
MVIKKLSECLPSGFLHLFVPFKYAAIYLVQSTVILFIRLLITRFIQYQAIKTTFASRCSQMLFHRARARVPGSILVGGHSRYDLLLVTPRHAHPFDFFALINHIVDSCSISP